MEEIWKDIKHYVGFYQVSEYSAVRSVDRIDNAGRNMKGRILKARLGKQKNKKYYQVVLSKGGKTKMFSCHRLCALEFVPNPENKPFVNHADGDTTNNHYTNFEWMTNAENIIHGHKRRGTSKMV